MATLATITSQNQLTIPKEVISALNFEGLRKVLLSIKDETLIVKPLSSKVDSLAGSLSYFAVGKPTDLKKIKKETETRVAAEIAREGL